MLQYLLHSTVPLTYANDISHNLSSTVHIRNVKWHLCITAGRKADWLNDWVFDWWKVSDVLPFAVAIILLPSISLILSPLTYCITFSPTPLNQAAALPLPSSSHWYPLEHFTGGFFGRFLMRVTVWFSYRPKLETMTLLLLLHFM